MSDIDIRQSDRGRARQHRAGSGHGDRRSQGADLREAIDIDSMDFLNFITAIHQRLGIDIPELDYPKLVTLNGAVTYLTEHLKSAQS